MDPNFGKSIGQAMIFVGCMLTAGGFVLGGLIVGTSIYVVKKFSNPHNYDELFLKTPVSEIKPALLNDCNSELVSDIDSNYAELV